MSSEVMQESVHLLAMPAHILERIIGWLDRVQDIILLCLASRAAHAAVAQIDWTGVPLLRLSHGAPSPAEAARIACKCPGLRELDATGCARYLPESLQALARVPLQVLRLSGCTALESRQGAAAINSMLEHGALRVLELCAGGHVPACDAALQKGVLRQRDLESLSVSSCRWNEASVEGLAELGTACPHLRHLRIEQCNMMLGDVASFRQVELESLSLAGSKWRGMMGYAGSQLKQLDVSGTNIRDSDIMYIVEANMCPLLERLNISQCADLTDESTLSLAISDIVTQGRLWDLDISAMGLGFSGKYLRRMLSDWACAHRWRHTRLGISSPRVWHAPALRFNISCNPSVEPEHLVGFLTRHEGQYIRMSDFRAQSCPRLARPSNLLDNTYHNILSAMAGQGNFCQLETLDLRDVFYASQQSAEANGAILASAIRGTAHCLKRLLIDNGCAGAEVAEAITSRGARLEELSMPCCTGLDDAGLQGIAAACVKLQRLCVGGPSRAWSETQGLAAFSNLRVLEICRRSLLTSGQLGQVLGQHPALEALKLCSCPRVTDEALELLPARCLKGLTLVCCDAVQGKPLYKLKKLETLEFSSCNAVTEQAIQVIAVSCTRLRRLALPKQIPTSCIPTQATGHLRGLQVLGGCMGPSTKAKATKHH